MNFNNRNDTYMNDNLHNGDVSTGVGLLTPPPDSESSNL